MSAKGGVHIWGKFTLSQVQILPKMRHYVYLDPFHGIHSNCWILLFHAEICIPHLVLRMYCIDTEALVFMFNGGTSYGFTIHTIFTWICMLYLHY